MRPNSQFTSPENRFFYPVNHIVEHHESLNTAALPSTEIIPGEDHYVVVAKTSTEKYAAELGWNNYNVPANATILGIRGYKREPGADRVRKHFIDVEGFDSFDEDCSYIPLGNEGTLMIVQIDLSCFWGDIPDARFDETGIAILPFGAPLPKLAKGNFCSSDISYRLLGLINPSDKLVTWHTETSYTTTLIDWCVVNQLKQNRLEEALLHDALPQGGHLVDILGANEAAKAYLQYFDDKHGTSYVPEQDPRYPYSKSVFEPLSEADFQTYTKLAELANRFMTSPR